MHLQLTGLVFSILIFGGSTFAKAKIQNGLPAGCKIVGSENAPENYSDGMHYVTVLSCADRAEVYFVREAKKNEKPDFLDADGSYDFPNKGRIILKKENLILPKGMSLLAEGWRGFHCEGSQKLSDQNNGSQRVLIVLDIKKLKLYEYYAVNFKENNLKKFDGMNKKCFQNTDD